MLTFWACLYAPGGWISATPAVWGKGFAHQLTTRFVGSHFLTFHISLLLFISKAGYRLKYKDIYKQSKNCYIPEVLSNMPKPEVVSAYKWCSFRFFICCIRYFSFIAHLGNMENTVPSSATERPRLVTSWPASKHEMRRFRPRCMDEFVFIERPSEHFQRWRVVAYKVICWCLVFFLCDFLCLCAYVFHLCSLRFSRPSYVAPHNKHWCSRLGCKRSESASFT